MLYKYKILVQKELQIFLSFWVFAIKAMSYPAKGLGASPHPMLEGFHQPRLYYLHFSHGSHQQNWNLLAALSV